MFKIIQKDLINLLKKTKNSLNIRKKNLDLLKRTKNFRRNMLKTTISRIKITINKIKMINLKKGKRRVKLSMKEKITTRIKVIGMMIKVITTNKITANKRYDNIINI